MTAFLRSQLVDRLTETVSMWRGTAERAVDAIWPLIEQHIEQRLRFLRASDEGAYEHVSEMLEGALAMNAKKAQWITTLAAERDEARRQLDAIRALCDKADRKGYADVDTHRIQTVLAGRAERPHEEAPVLVYDHEPIKQAGCNICVCGEPVDEHYSPAGTETCDLCRGRDGKHKFTCHNNPRHPSIPAGTETTT